MKNAAGDYDCEKYVPLELREAGIKIIDHNKTIKHPEVYTQFSGELFKWEFKRAWKYWVASGPILPFEYATPLHILAGQKVRVDGHCGCPSPEEVRGEEAEQRAFKEFNEKESQDFYKEHPEIGDRDEEGNPIFKWKQGVDLYHIDTQEGLNLLSAVIKLWHSNEVKEDD